MSTMQRVFVLAGGASWEGPLLTQLDVLSDVTVVRRCIDVADLLAASQTDHADVALIDPTIPGLDLDVVDRLSVEGIDLWAIGLGGDHLGIEYSIPADDVMSVGERLRNERSENRVPNRTEASDLSDSDSPSRPLGQVTAVWGPAGAPGRSTVALAAAAHLARQGKATLLIDADCHGAALAQMLAVLDDVSGLMAACRDVNLGRDRHVREHLLRAMPNLDILTGIPRPDLWHHLRPSAVARIVEQARESHQHVIIDCSFDLATEEGVAPSAGDVSREMVALADRTVVVGRPDPVGIARMLRAIDTVADRAQKLLLVMNGIRPSTPWDRQHISDMIFRVVGEHQIAYLPFDAEACDRALLQGESVTEAASDSNLATELGLLADMISSTLEPADSPRL